MSIFIASRTLPAWSFFILFESDEIVRPSSNKAMTASLEKVVDLKKKRSYQNLSFYELEITAFGVWKVLLISGKLLV